MYYSVQSGGQTKSGKVRISPTVAHLGINRIDDACPSLIFALNIDKPIFDNRKNLFIILFPRILFLRKLIFHIDYRYY